MSFPETRNSLIFRLSTQNASEIDWRDFMVDYWEPLVRFARRIGATEASAEDVASDAIGVLLKSDLLQRWTKNRASRLRGLLCGVVRNLLANEYRVETNRRRILEALAASGGMDGRLPALLGDEPIAEDVDAFEQIWADELLQRAFRQLAQQLYEQGKGDYFRALYSQVSEERSVAEIASLLELKVTQVENGLKSARRQLTEIMRQLVSHQVQQYSLEEGLASEFDREWLLLASQLERSGGLDAALRSVAKERGLHLFSADNSSLARRLALVQSAAHSIPREDDRPREV